MQLDLPNHLESTRDLLMRSLIIHPEQAPAMPAGLSSDLAARFAPREVAVSVAAPVSWFEKVRGFLGTPAFGAAAAAVVVLGVAVPMASGPADRGSETFRGQSAPVAAETVRIIFIGQNPGIVSAIRASGEFEASAISTIDSPTATKPVSGPAVIVDFTSGSLMAVDREGATVHRTDLSSDATEVAAAIASALSRF
jgi:hypothetical protein